MRASGRSSTSSRTGRTARAGSRRSPPCRARSVLRPVGRRERQRRRNDEQGAVLRRRARSGCQPGSVAPLLNGVARERALSRATSPSPRQRRRPASRCRSTLVALTRPVGSSTRRSSPRPMGSTRSIAEGSDGSTASTSFVIDTKGPIISVTGPPSPGSDTTPSFTFSASEPGVFNCKIDGGNYSACSSPFTAAELSDGSHTFSVFGIDGNGNGGPGEAESVSIVIDATPPETEVAGPSGPTASTSATFVLGPVPGATFECKLDDGAFEPCTTPRSYTAFSRASTRSAHARRTPSGTPIRHRRPASGRSTPSHPIRASHRRRRAPSRTRPERASRSRRSPERRSSARSTGSVGERMCTADELFGLAQGTSYRSPSAHGIGR